MKKNLLTVTALSLLLAAPASAVRVHTVTTPHSFVNQSVVKVRLARLLGQGNFNIVKQNFGTTSTLQQGRQVVAFTGCRPHDCGNNGSLVMYDKFNDAFKVAFTINGRTRIYKERAWHADRALNNDVRTYLNGMVTGN